MHPSKESNKYGPEILLFHISRLQTNMLTTVIILLILLKYCFNLMERENSLNGVQKLYIRGTIYFEVQTAQMRYCTPKWGTGGNPGFTIK